MRNLPDNWFPPPGEIGREVVEKVRMLQTVILPSLLKTIQSIKLGLLELLTSCAISKRSPGKLRVERVLGDMSWPRGAGLAAGALLGHGSAVLQKNL